MQFLRFPCSFKFQSCIVVWWNLHYFVSSLSSMVFSMNVFKQAFFLANDILSLILLQELWMSFDAPSFSFTNYFEGPFEYGRLDSICNSPSPFTFNTNMFYSLLWAKTSVSYVSSFRSTWFLATSYTSRLQDHRLLCFQSP
jgi:ABC-type sugar transport system permease subunit